jgi:hypothetical protein
MVLDAQGFTSVLEVGVALNLGFGLLRHHADWVHDDCGRKLDALHRQVDQFRKDSRINNLLEESEEFCLEKRQELSIKKVRVEKYVSRCAMVTVLFSLFCAGNLVCFSLYQSLKFGYFYAFVLIFSSVGVVPASVAIVSVASGLIYKSIKQGLDQQIRALLGSSN